MFQKRDEVTIFIAGFKYVSGCLYDKNTNVRYIHSLFHNVRVATRTTAEKAKRTVNVDVISADNG